jgi:hypothetical protein
MRTLPGCVLYRDAYLNGCVLRREATVVVNGIYNSKIIFLQV